MREIIHKFTIVYLPLYFLLEIVIYVLEIEIFAAIDNSTRESWSLAFYVILSFLKLVFAAVLGITTLLFA